MSAQLDAEAYKRLNAESEKKTNVNGGQAFPCGHHRDGNSADKPGMTLLDWFAGQALVGLLAADHAQEVGFDKGAEWAYSHAAAMLAEKAKREAKP